MKTIVNIEKIKKLHGVFKSICEGFAINLTEYTQLFGNNEASFSIWDTEGYSHVDALELFTGLLLFADARTEDRIKLIFELFDFNEIESLSLADFEYLLECCIISSCKLHNLPLDLFSSAELAKYVSEIFDEDQRITFPQILKYCASDPAVGTFFKIFKISEIERKFVARIDRLLASAAENMLNPEIAQPRLCISPSSLFRTRRFTEYVAWLSDAKEAAMSRIAEAEGPENEKSEISAALKWVYGINMNTNPPIQYAPLPAVETKVNPSESQLVYTVGATVVVYNPHTHKQQYYLEHRHSISCVAISANNKWVASAEHNGVSGKATIHVWNIKDFSNAAFIRSSHRGPILSMAFTGSDQFLLTIGATKPAPLIFYRWEENTVHTSAVVWDVPLEIQPKRNEGDNVIEIVTQTQIIEMRIVDGSPQFEEYCRIQDHSATIKQESITAGRIIHTNENMPRLASRMSVLGLTGHPDGTLLYWSEGKLPESLGNYQGQITSIKPLASEFAIATASGHVLIWDVPDECTQVIDLSALEVKFISQSIVSLDAIGQCLLLATRGDIVQLDLRPELLKPSITRFHKICYNPGLQKALTIIEPTPSLSYIAIAGDEGTVLVYDSQEFSLTDIWRIGFGVTSLHSMTAPEVGCTVAAGTTNGMIYVMSYNDMDDYRLHCASNRILDLKISLTGESLVAGSEDHYIYLYQMERGRFVSSAARKYVV